jgi:hypothetical protein
MNVYRANELHLNGRRTFPWTAADYDPLVRFCDFRSHPELIESSLEDFVPWAHCAGVTDFYSYLRWLNGPESELESEDCAFRGVVKNETPDQFHKRLQTDGRVMLHFRRLLHNCNDASAQWLLECFEHYLRQVKQEFVWGCIGLSQAPTFFKEIQSHGLTLTMNFWSWGDDEGETMENFRLVVNALREASQYVSQEIGDNACASAGS